MPPLLENVVGATMTDLTTSGKIFATHRVFELKELAQLSPRGLVDVIRKLGPENQSICKLHWEIALRAHHKDYGNHDTKLAANRYANEFQLIIANSEKTTDYSNISCKVLPHKSGGTVLELATGSAVVDEGTNLLVQFLVATLPSLIYFVAEFQQRALAELDDQPAQPRKRTKRAVDSFTLEKNADLDIGFVLVPEQLEEPLESAMRTDGVRFERISRVDNLPTQFSLSVRIIMMPTVEVLDAYEDWIEGIEFRELSEQALNSINATWLESCQNPWLWLFVAMNFFDSTRFHPIPTGGCLVCACVYRRVDERCR